MKQLIPLVLFSCMLVRVQSQDIPQNIAEQLEEATSATENETEDDSFIQELEQFMRKPLELNSVVPGDLESFPFLSAIQISSFVRYREVLGPLSSLYELQAVPSWDLRTIRKILPYVKVTDPMSAKELIKSSRQGDHEFVLRTSGNFLNGPESKNYPGDAYKLFFRYRFSYKNRLQWGLTADKDAGERFFRGPQRLGFDFYSAHIFIKNTGFVKTFVLGDYSVNMGQGLVQWQSLAFGKGADLSVLKRQSPVIRPYTSAGEHNFMRGAAITLAKNRWSSSLLFSLRKLDANVSDDAVTSLLTSGYHRNEAELADKNVLAALSAGSTVTYKTRTLSVGLNGMFFRFDHVIQKKDEPYNLYSMRGDRWWNASMDHSYTHQNFHLFGEMALGRHGATAFVEGLLISLHRDVDLSIFYRQISPGYQALYGNAFTESTSPTNETGVYAGVCLRPSATIRLDLFADIFRFPWLRFRTDSPSGGSEYSVQMLFTPSKHTSFQVRFRNRRKEMNQDPGIFPTRGLATHISRDLRCYLVQRISERYHFRGRVELRLIERQGTGEEGFLIFSELISKTPGRKFGWSARACVFETDSYDSRIYAFESNVLYNYSIPSFSGRGARFYFNGEFDLSKNLTLWARFFATIYNGATSINGSADPEPGQLQPGWVIQVRARL